MKSDRKTIFAIESAMVLIVVVYSILGSSEHFSPKIDHFFHEMRPECTIAHKNTSFSALRRPLMLKIGMQVLWVMLKTYLIKKLVSINPVLLIEMAAEVLPVGH